MYRVWIAMVLGCAGCTAGQVVDATSGTSLAGAALKFEHIDTSITQPGQPRRVTVTFLPQTQQVVSGPPVTVAAVFNYWLDPYAQRSPGDGTDTVVVAGWNRVTVSAAGHATGRFYRNHQYVDYQVQTNVPYSGGPYPIPSVWNLQNGIAAIEDFQIYPTSAHPLWPDLIVDVRSIAMHQIGQVFINNVVCPSTRCLVFGLNIANVSNGSFELVSHTSSPATISQVVTQSAGPPTSVAISGGLLRKPPDDGWHVAGLARISLRGPIISGECDTEPTAIACPAVVSGIKDICLTGSGSVFDGAYGGTGIQQATLNCWPNGSADTPTGLLHTGLAPGFAEFYGIGSPENILDVAGLPAGTYWLEAEVNPDRTYREADYSNNVARVQLTL